MFNFFKKKKPIAIEEVFQKEPQDYTNIELIANYFKNETGVTFENQTSILNNKVTTFCKLREISSFKKLINIIEHNAQIKQELIDYLTTNETFFYREIKQILELVELVKKAYGHVDILCAPSATGEEPYSIAIALLEAGVESNKFNIVGIDINSDALKKARAAVYRERNVRNLTPEIIAKYFTKNENSYHLDSMITSLVTFKLTNLFDASFKSIGKFDFIFSRNMLIYFDKETKIKAKEILESMRKDNKQNIFFGHADLF
jgi:chemotaxis protein methyltransferase CheR